MDIDRQSDIAALDTTLTTVERVLDIDALRARIEKLEHEASDPNLWDDQSRAQQLINLALPDEYIVALNLAPNTPAWLQRIGHFRQLVPKTG